MILKHDLGGRKGGTQQGAAFSASQIEECKEVLEGNK